MSIQTLEVAPGTFIDKGCVRKGVTVTMGSQWKLSPGSHGPWRECNETWASLYCHMSVVYNNSFISTQRQVNMVMKSKTSSGAMMARLQPQCKTDKRPVEIMRWYHERGWVEGWCHSQLWEMAIPLWYPRLHPRVDSPLIFPLRTQEEGIIPVLWGSLNNVWAKLVPHVLIEYHWLISHPNAYWYAPSPGICKS